MSLDTIRIAGTRLADLQKGYYQMATDIRDLGIGDWVKVLDWCGRIDDIATSEDGAVMLKIVSFKGIWNHHPYEWLEYREGAIVRASFEQVQLDYERFLSYASENAEDIECLHREASK
jgi:hypothetical protein